MGALEGEDDRVIVTHMLSGVIELFVSDPAVLCPQTCWPGPDPPQHCPGSHSFCWEWECADKWELLCFSVLLSLDPAAC